MAERPRRQDAAPGRIAIHRRAAAQRDRQGAETRAARTLSPEHGMTTTTAYEPLGASGLKVSKLWLGTMMFGDQTTEAEAASIVDATREAGVNAIDTANAYAGGESERITRRLIKGDRERWVLATKLANPMGSGPNDRGLSRRHIMAAFDASLVRLDTDWVDV